MTTRHGDTELAAINEELNQLPWEDGSHQQMLKNLETASALLGSAQQYIILDDRKKARKAITDAFLIARLVAEELGD